MIPFLSVLLPSRANGRRELHEAARPLVDGVLGVVEMIARNEKLEPVLAGIAALVEERAAGLRCAVMLLRNGRLYHAAGNRVPRAFVAAVNGLPVGSGAPRPSAPFWDPSPRHSEIAADPRWNEFRGAALACGLAACWSFPLLSATGEVLGVLAAYAGPERPRMEGEQELLASAGRLAAVSIEQRNLMDDLAHQAGHDPLTRLANRYLFDDRLQQALYAAERTRQPVALLAIDLDRFGSVNDLLGHRVGDALLEQVARRLESCIRKSDTLARTGGDEFTLVLPALACHRRRARRGAETARRAGRSVSGSRARIVRHRLHRHQRLPGRCRAMPPCSSATPPTRCSAPKPSAATRCRPLRRR